MKLPESNVTLVGVKDAMGPLVTVGRKVANPPMVPLKPLRLINVNVKPVVRPVKTLAVDTGRKMRKSTTCTVTMTERTSSPLVPVTFTAKLPTLDEPRVRVSVEVPPAARVTLPELSAGERPAMDVVSAAGEMDSTRLTVPAKPPVLVSVIVEVADEPAAKLRVPGEAEMGKLGRKSRAPT